MKIENKIKKLENIIEKLGSAVVAYSGGVDSSFLSKTALDILGKENILAVTASSSTYPVFEFNNAKKTANLLDIPWMSIISEELNIKGFKQNSLNRCYFCKKELYIKIKNIAKKKGFNAVLDGSNFDDQNDFRPGMKALKELGIISPLKMAGITKNDIRFLSKRKNIPVWNKPSFACLASRFPYGETITRQKLTRAGKAEDYLRTLKLGQIRVRVHNKMARIEVLPEDFNKIITNRNLIIKEFKKLGYNYVTLDLTGYRTGSMNEVIKRRKR